MVARIAGKKLIQVARAFCDAAKGKDEVIEDARLFGIELNHQNNGDCIVMGENWDAVKVFVASQTQWRFSHSGHFIGLDYNACGVVIRAMGIKLKAVFSKLQTMEAEVIRYHGDT